VAIDLRRGAGGTAYITDASPNGPNGIVVVDLASGKSFRRLNGHASTRPDPGCVLRVEGEPLLFRAGPAKGKPLAVGADGLALTPDGGSLYYAPLSSRHWFRVDAEALADSRRSETDVARTVEDLGDKEFASDGLLGGADGSVYFTDVENNAIRRRPGPGGPLEIVVDAPQLLWPDSMALASDGTLYFTATQIERGEAFRGSDERRKPFTLWQVRVGTPPIRLR